MTDSPPDPASAPAAPGGPPARVSTGGPWWWWRTSIVTGTLAVLAVAVAGQAIALAVWIGGGPGSITTSLRLGWLYTCLFDAVPLDLELRDLPFLTGSSPGSFAGTLGLALLTGTVGALFACFLAGRRTARGSATRWAGCLRGGSVAVSYAILAGLVSVPIELTIALVPAEPGSGSLLVRPSMPGAFLWPFLIASIGGLAGGYVAGGRNPGRDRSARFEAAAVGGWWMLVAGIAFSLAGVVVLAILHPDATSAYAGRVTSAGPRVGALVVGHQALTLPNQAMFVLAPAMGACDTVRGERGDLDALCLGRVPARLDGSLLSPGTGPRPNVGDAPVTFWLLTLAPAVATVGGGMVAARRLGRASGSGPVLVGAAAGLVYALLCGITAFLASVRASGELVAGAAKWVGPRPVTTALIAIPWGVVGGALGGAVVGGRRAGGVRSASDAPAGRPAGST